MFFSSICKDLALSEKSLAKTIKITTNTLSLRKKEGVFSLSESERLYKIRQIYDKTVETFQDEKMAKDWLKQPYWLLKDLIPIDFVATEKGSKEVETLLDHIKNGWLSFVLPA